MWTEITVGLADWREVAVSHAIKDRELGTFCDVLMRLRVTNVT